tara:strand:- start:2666 stop:2818 length:153 start_codon:yes stop_codon:yes gene_type:complete
MFVLLFLSAATSKSDYLQCLVIEFDDLRGISRKQQIVLDLNRHVLLLRQD